MRRRRAATTAFAFLVTACGPARVTVARHVTVSERPVTLPLVPPLPAPGTTTEVCLRFPARAGVGAAADSLTFPDGRGAHVGAAFVRADGRRERLVHPGEDRPSASPEGPSFVCLWTHPGPAPGRTYVRLELWSDRPLTVDEVQVWNGVRGASL